MFFFFATTCLFSLVLSSILLWGLERPGSLSPSLSRGMTTRLSSFDPLYGKKEKEKEDNLFFEILSKAFYGIGVDLRIWFLAVLFRSKVGRQPGL